MNFKKNTIKDFLSQTSYIPNCCYLLLSDKEICLYFRCNRFIDLGPRTWFALRAAKIHVYRGTEETGQGKVKTTSALIHGNKNLLHQNAEYAIPLWGPAALV